MPVELAVIVPTRGRPENIRKVIGAWDFTNAWDVADLILAIDADDPEYDGYMKLREETEHPDTGDPLFSVAIQSVWLPMVYKLDRVAVAVAERRKYFAVGFAGDDHLPQTIGWAQRYLTVLREMGSGMVYGDDGYQGIKLSTEWAVTSDAVRALGRMVPAPVEHMYCDNAMMDLFNQAGALRHLPEVRIEHMHPVAGKAETDAQYQRVNHRDQFRKDRMAYERWGASTLKAAQVHMIRELRPDATDYQVAATRPTTPTPALRTRGEIRRSGPSQRKADMARFPFSREFKEVRGATPDEIGMTLADFAVQVPADQEIVELGVFQGRTALIMAWGAKQGHGAHVTAIDPWDLPGNVYDPPFTDEQSKAWAHYRVRELGYADRIALVQAFSDRVAADWPDLVFGGKPVGLLYVDGDHTREGARRDIESWASHLAPGAVIAVDDYGHPDWPGVGQAVDELVAEGLLAPIEIYHDRLAVTHLAEGTPKVTSITSEGVSPAPYTVDVHLPEGEDWMTEPNPEDHARLAEEWRRVDPEGVAALEASAEELTRKSHVQSGELDGVAEGTSIEDLNLPQLKALAKHRNIVLGARKDKKDLILQALRAGE